MTCSRNSNLGSGLSESFEAKISSQFRDIIFKKTLSVKKCQAEYLAITNQVGGDFQWQPATFDNPLGLIAKVIS